MDMDLFRIMNRDDILPFLFITQSVLVKILCGAQASTLPVLYYQDTILANVIAPILRKSSSYRHYSQFHGSGTCLCGHNGELASALPWDHFCDVAGSLLRGLLFLLLWTLASKDSLQVVSVLLWCGHQDNPEIAGRCQMKIHFTVMVKVLLGIVQHKSGATTSKHDFPWPPLDYNHRTLRMWSLSFLFF